MNPVLKKLGLDKVNSGTWLGAKSLETAAAPLIDSLNPASGELIARVRSTTDGEYEKLLAAARESFLEWRKIPAPARGDAIRRVGNALRDNKDALGSLVTLEMGKIKAEGDGEVQEMIDIADFAVGQSRMLYGNAMHSERPMHRMYEQWHPLGVVGTISAFNFPVAVWSWNAFIAAICGNINVWKPSPKTPLCGVAVQKICNEALSGSGLPDLFYLFNDGENKLAQKFVDDRRVDLVSFTGSTAVGRKVGERVAARMGKCLLELGGNNAIIVDKFANMDIAVPGIVFGSVGTAGQRCTSTRRIIVHESRMDELQTRLVNAYEQVRIGDPLDKKTLMGPLIDESAVERFERAVKAVQAAGGKLLCGGKRIDRPGHFVEPAIALAKNEFDIVQSETFGPILYLIPFKSLDEAIGLQNGVAQGLSSAIFTDNLQNAEYFLSNAGSDCGIANVNIGTSGAEIGGAFGGEKETGGGREAGSDSWKAYMRRQTNTINWGRDLPLAQGIDFKL
ncbi:MAG: aldehyde dehydrogenase family protein [Gammaproteobacteria bacterium]|nr:aldehyde dehydrogenase family protein [Gammaproteobacteria bacterium]MDH4313714.1 aldehyde dehydrogenase family protein [Gammaproteobacteria bacterium]